MNKEEFSIDLSEETAEKLKDILGIKEVEEIHKRFENGTETIEDLLKNYISYHIKFEFRNKEIDTEMIELKYYKKLINLIQKQEKIIDKYKNALVNCDCEICNQVLGECCKEYEKEVDKECEK